MKTHPQVELNLFRNGQKFLWNDKIYTVYAHEKGMSEVFDGTRFWSWNSNAKVTPITFDN